ncbi:MAG: hypothetical protein GQ564_12105 [Bacteroidales bacterium]|nr:hypothetical protein [Bacteroidales bacterium]
MKKIKYILIFILSVGMFNSCLIEDETDLDLNAESLNTAGFRLGAKNVAAVSDGEEYSFTIDLNLVGATSMDVTNDITLTIAAHSSSTAIEGTHFRIDNPTVVLEAANNHLAKINFTMLTDGIFAPLEESPVMVLEITSANGDTKVINSGKTISVILNYACFSSLAGTYDVNVEYWRFGALQDTYDFVDVITEIGTGEYHTTRVGHWSIASLGGTPGFVFLDVCNVISIPGQNLVDTYSNWVEGVGGKSISDPANGTMYMEYTIVTDAAADDRTYYANYVKQ